MNKNTLDDLAWMELQIYNMKPSVGRDIFLTKKIKKKKPLTVEDLVEMTLEHHLDTILFSLARVRAIVEAKK